MLKYFNSNRISIIIFISLFPAVYWIPSLFPSVSPQIPEVTGVPLGRLILAFNRDFRLLSSLVALILVIVNGYLLIELNTIYIFIPARTQLPSYFYGVLVMGMSQLHQLTPALVSSTMLVLVFYRIFSAYKVERISLNFLDAGMLISLASLIYFPTLVFFLFLLASLIILRPFIWREWTFAVLGLIIPYIFLISVYFLADISFAGYFTEIADSLNKVEQHFKLSQVINWSFVLVFMLIGSYYMASAIDKMKIHASKFFFVYLFFFLFSVIIYMVIPGSGLGMIFFVSIPLAYLFSYYFVRCRRNWVNEILFLLFLMLLLWQRI